MTNKHEQLSFEEEHTLADNEPVVCLGMTFKNDDERREYFRNELRKRLPELKKIEGFPIGEDEDIIELSDPPYYTACPNPWINDFIEEWEREKKEKYNNESKMEYQRDPFTSDVSEGKTDPLYMAHSYHTKVPHRAVMRYILHYTNPGDIIYDGFCGTGMTGLAAQLCGDINEVEKLGYTVTEDGKVYDKDSKYISKLGPRKMVLNDLAPSATFISSNYNVKSKFEKMYNLAIETINTLEKKYCWLYQTQHEIDKGKTAEINYMLWSDVYICDSCTKEIVYWEVAVNEETFTMEKEIYCNHCDSKLVKRSLKRSFITNYDPFLKKSIRQAKQIPVLINYQLNGEVFFKKPDEHDLKLIDKINNDSLFGDTFIPTNRIPHGFNTKQPINSHGFVNSHHFYTRRNLLIFTKLWELAQDNPLLKFALTSIMVKTGSKLHNVGLRNGKVNLAGALPNVLFVPSILAERNIFILLKRKIANINRAGFSKIRKNNVISTSSFGSDGQENIYDYIFIDPPFGSNLMYSELNFLWESWLKVFTENKYEAIENKEQNKTLEDYGDLMRLSFQRAYKMLKPDRWITIEFSNTSATVWNIIQNSLQSTGFVIANVSSLNKGQGTFYAQTNPTSVKQDLIITAYKPSTKMVKGMNKESSDKGSVWIFIENHLLKLPKYIGVKGKAQTITERTPRILFDRMVAYHVQNGLPVPISSADFQVEIAQRYPMRDGMVFLESQIAEYDKKRILVKEFSQTSLFVSDENSAIEWIRQQLMKKPQSRQDIHPNFMKEIQHIERHEILPELDDLLNQNFLIYEGEGAVPDQIVAYFRQNFKDLRGLEPDDEKVVEKAMNRWYVPDPNKQADLERLRERALLREFEGYLQELESHRRQLRQFRTEAVCAGFKKAYSERNFEQIVQVGDRLPKRILEADDKLLMYYDNASIRLGM